jgi:hypothetical protein
MNQTKTQQHSTMYIITQKHELYGYTSLETLAEWNRKLPKKKQASFTYKKITKLSDSKQTSRFAFFIPVIYTRLI